MTGASLYPLERSLLRESSVLEVIYVHQSFHLYFIELTHFFTHPCVIGLCQVTPWMFSRTEVDELVKKLGLPEENDILSIYQTYLIFTKSYWGMQKHVQKKAWQWGEAESGITGSSSVKELLKNTSEREKRKEKMEILVQLTQLIFPQRINEFK